MAKWQRYTLNYKYTDLSNTTGYSITNGVVESNLCEYLGGSASTFNQWIYPIYQNCPSFNENTGYSVPQKLCVAASNYQSAAFDVCNLVFSVSLANGQVPFYYTYNTGQLKLVVIINEFYDYENYVLVYNASALSMATPEIGTYVDDISGNDGDYPDNGIVGDYWYILVPKENDSSFVNTGNTIYKTIPHTNIDGIIYKLTPYTNIGGIIYELVTSVKYKLNSINFDKFFTTSGGSAASTDWTYSVNESNGIVLNPNNAKGTNSYHNTTSTISFVAQNDLSNVKITGAYYTETLYDTITITCGDTSILNAASGENSSYSSDSFSISEGTVLTFTYSKDVSGDGTNEEFTKFYITCDPITG